MALHLALLLAGCAPELASRDVLLPTDFSGWVEVEFASATASDGTILVDASGRGRSRALMIPGATDTTYRTAAGELPVLERQGVGYDAACATVRSQPFVCCVTTGTRAEGDGPTRSVLTFYVGKGPACGAAP
jgi:hypothetical protein